LEDQLARQRTSTRNLASLAERFELSNAMVAPNSTTIETSISALLEALGTMVAASNVELRIDDDHVEGLLPRSTTWRRPPSEGARADADGGPTAIIEDIKVGTRSVGHLSADPVGAPDAAQYLGLAAEHLAGLIHRLDLVAQVADSAVEDERHRIAMELHDSVTQRMYSVSFLADAAVHEAGEASPELAELVERIRELVLSSLAELRVLLLELRPTSFDDVELHLLLEQLADNLMSAYDAEIIVDAASSPPMTTEIKTALYRISQEAISNACRHGHPDRIIVELAQDGDLVSLAVRDDGVGFDTTSAGIGAGLDNLRSRAGSIDAEIAITSSPGAGTSVVVRYARPAPSARSTEPSDSVGAGVTEGAPR
ncbi:sensor histidine kinase, partial [Ilumatobacter sp.]|uniref:sensor histidine kinase n=1 Tax=Ilumatobacter sp. TaxID=1967498 RepID=UPI003AF9C29B